MNRFLAFIAALLAAAVSVSSACTAAASPYLLQFTLHERSGSGDPLQLSFRDADKDRHHSFSSGFRADELSELDLAAFRAGGTHPLGFALIREPGRIDCRGNGGNASASGTCAFTPNQAFSDLLAAHGIARPSLEQAYELAITGANRDLVGALAQYHYPTPTIEKLTELAAVGADRGYMAALATHGYRPDGLQNLVEMAAVGVDPSYIASIARAGYPNLAADELVQLRALDIDPAFIAGFARVGYAKLPVETLVELKALDVTPDYVQALAKNGVTGLSAQQLGMLKAVTSERRKH